MEYQMINAYVIIIERKGSSPRFYASHDKKVKSAWCLAGAKLFQTGTGVKDGIQTVEAHLTEKGISFRRVTVSININ
jgi:hypothetical protein